MKLKIGLLLACSSILAGLIVTQLRAADAAVPKHMPSEWQYQTFNKTADYTLDEELNKLAKDGWEIVSVSYYMDTDAVSGYPDHHRAFVTAKKYLVGESNPLKKGK
jgi:hypothetical protein